VAATLLFYDLCMETLRFLTLRALIPLAVLLNGCASGPLLYTKEDPAKGEITTGVIRNRLADVQPFGRGAILYLSPKRIVSRDGNEHFQFIVQLQREGGPYVLIKPGRSLVLDIDGLRTFYVSQLGSGPRRTLRRRFLGKPIYSESAVYAGVTERDIDLIAHANHVNVQINAQKQRISAELSEQNLAAFEALLENTATRPVVATARSKATDL
jgi:hypothetical protein